MKKKKMIVLCMITLCILWVSACNRDSKNQTSSEDSEVSTEVVEPAETTPEDLLTDVIELPEYTEEGNQNTDSNNETNNNLNGNDTVFEDGIEKNNEDETGCFGAEDVELKENNTLQALADVPELDD